MRKTIMDWRVLSVLSLLLLFMACGDNAKVIKTKKKPTTKTTGVFSDSKTTQSSGDIQLPTNNSMPSVGADVHTVKALEVLHAGRYVYARVKEGDNEFWIVTLDRALNTGETYHYHGGVLKSGYKSLELNRVFDKIYLVSNIVSANHGMNQGMLPAGKAQSGQVSKTVAGTSGKIKRLPGSVKISDIIANPKKYAGKPVQVSGRVVKLNANIMGRNWMHLRDGSKDDYDFVVTSKQMIPEGGVATFKGTLHLKKDFGAGYFYDIILEDADVITQ